MQATFFNCLPDSSLSGRFDAILTTAWKEETLRSRDDSDFAVRVSDDDVTTGAKNVIRSGDCLAKLWNTFNRVSVHLFTHCFRPIANRLAEVRTYITPSDKAGVAISSSPIEFVAT